MKKLIILSIFSIFFVACGSNTSTEKVAEKAQEKVETKAHDHEHDMTKSEKAQKGPEFTSKYVCPMHCDGSGAMEEGKKCGACGMDLVYNAEYWSDYICPMHCEGSGSDKEGKCPACGMDYVKNEEHKHKG